MVTRPKVFAVVSALAFAMLSSLVVAQQSVYAQQQSSQTFTAKLTGKNEVPPVNTQATGMA